MMEYGYFHIMKQICDCCDGSDEKEGVCEDTCLVRMFSELDLQQKREERHSIVQKELDSAKRGHTTMMKRISEGKDNIDAVDAFLKSIKIAHKELSDFGDKLRTRLQRSTLIDRKYALYRNRYILRTGEVPSSQLTDEPYVDISFLKKHKEMEESSGDDEVITRVNEDVERPEDGNDTEETAEDEHSEDSGDINREMENEPAEEPTKTTTIPEEESDYSSIHSDESLEEYESMHEEYEPMPEEYEDHYPDDYDYESSAYEEDIYDDYPPLPEENDDSEDKEVIYDTKMQWTLRLPKLPSINNVYSIDIYVIFFPSVYLQRDVINPLFHADILFENSSPISLQDYLHLKQRYDPNAFSTPGFVDIDVSVLPTLNDRRSTWGL